MRTARIGAAVAKLALSTLAAYLLWAHAVDVPSEAPLAPLPRRLGVFDVNESYYERKVRTNVSWTRVDIEGWLPGTMDSGYSPLCDPHSGHFEFNNHEKLRQIGVKRHSMVSFVGVFKVLWLLLQLALPVLFPPDFPVSDQIDWEEDQPGEGKYDPRDSYRIANLEEVLPDPESGKFSVSKARNYFNARLGEPARKFNIAMPWTRRTQIFIFCGQCVNGMWTTLKVSVYGPPWFSAFYSWGWWGLTFRPEFILERIYLMILAGILCNKLSTFSESLAQLMGAAMLVVAAITWIPFVPALLVIGLMWFSLLMALDGIKARCYSVPDQVLGAIMFLAPFVVAWAMGVLSKMWFVDSRDTYLCPMSKLDLVVWTPGSVGHFMIVCLVVTFGLVCLNSVATYAQSKLQLLSPDKAMDIWLHSNTYESQRGDTEPQEKEGGTKPQEKKGDIKATEKDGETKPQEESVDTKPQEKEGDAEPQEEEGQSKAKEEDGGAKSKREKKTQEEWAKHFWDHYILEAEKFEEDAKKRRDDREAHLTEQAKVHAHYKCTRVTNKVNKEWRCKICNKTHTKGKALPRWFEPAAWYTPNDKVYFCAKCNDRRLAVAGKSESRGSSSSESSPGGKNEPLMH